MADRITARLQAQGLSAREASRRAGLDPSYISQIIRSPQMEPSPSKLKALAEVLEVNPDWLLTGVGEPPAALPTNPTVEVVNLFAGLDANDQSSVLRMMRALHKDKAG